MAKIKNNTDTVAQGFEIEQGTDNPAVVAEEAVMDTPEAPKGISLYIDPEGKETTAIMFALNNAEVSLKTIEDKIAESEKLTINGFLDRKGYEAVKKAKSEFLKTRTTLEKSDNENVIKPIEAWLKNRKATRDTLSEKLKAGQQKMQDKLDAIDKEFEEHQRKEEEAQQARLQGRVNALAAVGGVFSEEAGVYTFPHDTGLLINSIQVKTFEDAEWSDFVKEATDSYNTHQELLKKQREEQEAQDLKNKQLLEGLETKTTALQEKQVKLRTKELILNGALIAEDGFVLNGNNISSDVLKVMEDEDWDNLISMMTEPAVDEVEMEAAPEDEPGFTSGEHTVIIAGPPVAEANRPSGSIPFGGYAPSPGFEIEGDDHGDTMVEESTEVPVENTEVSVVFNHVFTESKPFIDHNFKKVTLRVFPPDFELHANEGVTAADIADAGMFAGTELKYLQIKRPQ